MDKSAIDSWAERSRAIDLDGIPWEDVRRIPSAPMPSARSATCRTSRATRSSTCASSSPRAPSTIRTSPAFLACWFYEETFHGRALARVLVAAGESPVERKRSRRTLTGWIEERAMGAVARAWPDFVAVHMVWGAINELTTLAGYQRLAELEPHPVLVDLLGRIIRDESRHFSFYYHQAERRLRSPGARRAARLLVDRFWAPVGAGCSRIRKCAFSPASSSGARPGSSPRARSTRPSGGCPASRTSRSSNRGSNGRPRADDGRGPDGTAGRWRQRRVPRDVREAQPIPNAPSSTNRRRAQGCTQASRAHGPRGPRGQQSTQRADDARRPAEGVRDTVRVAARIVAEHRLGREAGAAHRGSDALAREVARQAGRVADEQEAVSGDPPGSAALHGVGVAPERREREIVGQAPAGMQRGAQPLEAPRDRHAAAPRRRRRSGNRPS